MSVGNKPDVSGNDLLQYWEQDDDTDVVLLHLESFGNPRNFARITRRLTRTKPVVAVKSGRAVSLDQFDPDGWPAETSLDALLAQTGVIRVDTLEQLFDVARLLVDQPVPAGRRVAVVSNSWGPSVLAADACIGAGLVLAEYEPATQELLTALVSGGDVHAGIRTNPLDLGYRAGVDEFRSALTAVFADPGVDAVVVLCTPPVPAAVDDIADVIAEVATGTDVTVLATFLGLASHTTDEPGRRRVPVFEFPEAAAHALARVARYGEWRSQEIGEAPELDEALLDDVRGRVEELLGRDGPGWLTPTDASDLLGRFGLHLVDRAFAGSAEEAVGAARRIGHPVAIKATGVPRPAKTEAGGVAVDVHGDSEVHDAYERMAALLGDAMRPAVVQAMAPPGIDCNISIHQDRVDRLGREPRRRDGHARGRERPRRARPAAHRPRRPAAGRGLSRGRPAGPPRRRGERGARGAARATRRGRRRHPGAGAREPRSGAGLRRGRVHHRRARPPRHLGEPATDHRPPARRRRLTVRPRVSGGGPASARR